MSRKPTSVASLAMSPRCGDWRSTGVRLYDAKFADYLGDIRRCHYLSFRPNSAMDTLMHRAMREHGFRKS